MEATSNIAIGPEQPEWWKVGDLDAALLSTVLGYPIESAKLEPYNHFGGAVATLTKLIMVLPDNSKRTFIVKRLPDSALPRSIHLGLVRESHFFTFLKTNGIVPDGVVQCEYATCDTKTGQKLCVLEDLSGAKEGRWLLMRSHPLCANDDIPALTLEGPSQLEATMASFRTVARFHATFWNKTSDFEQQHWCTGSQWLRGEDRESWEKEQTIARGSWASFKESGATADWNDNVVKLVDASMDKINWDAARDRLKQEALTLCHGDFWPANVLVNQDSIPVFVDWELVRIGSGQQDLAQFMLNMDVDFRRKHEKELLLAYVDELNKHIDKNCKPTSFEETFEGYKYGGAAKLCWMLPLVTGFGSNFATFFHDSAQAWFEDFAFTTESIPQPRL